MSIIRKTSVIVCERCGVDAPRRGHVQKYCGPCSDIKDIERKERWLTSPTRTRSKDAASSAVIQRGKAISAGSASSFFDFSTSPSLVWMAKVAVPFDWAASKNFIYSTRGRGHRGLRENRNEFGKSVEQRIRHAVADQKIVHNKLWVSIFVQKPNHRGDAINFIHSICDALKRGIGLDDRWFSLRSVDWEIAKVNPRIFITVGQDTNEDALACSHCGRVLPIGRFQKSKSGPMGRTRSCGDCCKARVKKSRESAPMEAVA